MKGISEKGLLSPDSPITGQRESEWGARTPKNRRRLRRRRV